MFCVSEKVHFNGLTFGLFCPSKLQMCENMLAVFQETLLTFRVQEKSISLGLGVNTTAAVMFSAWNISFISAKMQSHFLYY